MESENRPEDSGEEKVFSAKLLAPNLRFIEGRFGSEALDLFLKRFGLTREFFQDVDNWVSYDFALKFNQALVEMMGDRNIMYTVGLFTATQDMGPIYFILKSLASPKLVYARLPATLKTLSRITSMEVLELTDSSARIKFMIHDKRYKDHPLFELKRKGMLASITLGLNLPPAKVEEEACISRGDEACIYRVSWQRRRIGLFTLLGFSFAVIFLFLSISGIIRFPLIISSLISLSTFLLFLGLDKVRQNTSLLLQNITTSKEQVIYLEDLFNKNLRKLQELEVLRDISYTIHQTLEEDQLLQVILFQIKAGLGYDRACIFLHDPSKEALVLAAHVGFSPQVVKFIEGTEVKMERGREEEGEDLFVNILRSRKGILIKNVEGYKKRIKERFAVLLERTGTTSFLAVPLFTAKEEIGIVVVDYITPGKELSERDQTLLEQLARQLSLAITNARLFRQIRENERILRESLLVNQKISKYLNPAIVSEILENPYRALELGGKLIKATVMFIDIVDFTRISSRLTPGRCVDLLNRFFEMADEIVEMNGGIVDKRLGDGMMVVFIERPGDGEELTHEYRAIKTGVEMISRLKSPGQEGGEALPGISVRIGISTGEVISGNVGSGSRYEYTVTGEIVNLAHRFQEICEENRIFLTREVYEKLKERFSFSPPFSMNVRGYRDPLEVYRL